MTVMMETDPPSVAGGSEWLDRSAIEALDAGELRRTFQELEVVRRRLEGAMAQVVGRMDELGLHRADGHASVAGLLRVAGWSNAEVRRARQLANLVETEPDIAAELSSGRLGVAQSHDLARARASPRVGGQLSEVVPIMLQHAERLSHREFQLVVRRWESLADTDGADQTAEAAHDGRDANVVELGEEIVVRANGATGPGAILRDVFDRFVAAEWDRDWADEGRVR